MLAPVYGLNSVDTHIARAACCEYGDASGPNSTAGITIYNTGNIKTSFTGGGAHLLPQLLTAARTSGTRAHPPGSTARRISEC